jgi:NAD(P)-dependent dehydrogenase (short-subunit alcohol dehydrogenase family)
MIRKVYYSILRIIFSFSLYLSYKIKPRKIYDFDKIKTNIDKIIRLIAKITEKNTEKYLYVKAIEKADNNIVTRHLQKTCYDLIKFDDPNNKTRKNIKLPNKLSRICYGCKKVTNILHHDYVYSCVQCGDKFEKWRYYSSSQEGKVAIVIGARTKLGHQIVIKLLKAGATVIGTSRYPQKMINIFNGYNDENLTKNLIIYPEGLDLDSSKIKEDINQLYKYVENKFNRLDILINSAAQTIRAREKNKDNSIIDISNKYGDSKYVEEKEKNSWTMTIDDLRQDEMEEIFRTNVIGPTLMIQTFIPLMKLSQFHPTIINVHAREGLINVKKSIYHIHTNYGKTCLHMLTKCLYFYNLKTNLNKKFRIHGCCPGFISVDEYYEKDSRYFKI